MPATKPKMKKTPAPSLSDLRAQIDEINSKLLKLIAQRARVVVEVGRFKQSNGGAVYQPVRERQILDKLVAENPGPLSQGQVEAIFTEIIAACRALEHPVRVAYLGPEHTYSHEAARQRFGASTEFVPEPSIAEVFHAMENGMADMAVVPVENSTEGSVPLTLDLLIDTPFVIIGEILLPIRHALLSRTRERAAIKKIVSHQQSLAQCRSYLAANFPRCELEAVASNAAAAKRASQEPHLAAIASAAAARPYGLSILAENIQDLRGNTTRFLVMGREETARSGADKTTVLFSVPDRVGALNTALGVFSRNSINISKIESRPLRSRPWEYLFFADLSGHRQEPGLKRALRSLAKKTLFLKILGSYPQGGPAQE